MFVGSCGPGGPDGYGGFDGSGRFESMVGLMGLDGGFFSCPEQLNR